MPDGEQEKSSDERADPFARPTYLRLKEARDAVPPLEAPRSRAGSYDEEFSLIIAHESALAIERHRKERIANDSAEQDKALRKGTAIFLAVGVSVIVVAQYVMLCLIGLGDLNFTKYPWLVDIVEAQNFGQVVGLAYLVVHNLFPTTKSLSKPLDKRIRKAILAGKATSNQLPAGHEQADDDD